MKALISDRQPLISLTNPKILSFFGNEYKTEGMWGVPGKESGCALVANPQLGLQALSMTIILCPRWPAYKIAEVLLPEPPFKTEEFMITSSSFLSLSISQRLHLKMQTLLSLIYHVSSV